MECEVWMKVVRRGRWVVSGVGAGRGGVVRERRSDFETWQL